MKKTEDDDVDYEMKKMVRRLMLNRNKQVERAVMDHVTLMMKISRPENPNDAEYKRIFGLSHL